MSLRKFRDALIVLRPRVRLAVRRRTRRRAAAVRGFMLLRQGCRQPRRDQGQRRNQTEFRCMRHVSNSLWWGSKC